MPISPERREELLRATLKADEPDVCKQWDNLVATVMERDNIDRGCAVDRLLSTKTGSDLWLRAQQYDARIPKIVEQLDANGNRVSVRTGNWSHVAGAGVARRIPRAP